MINLNNFNTFNFVNQKAFIFLLTTIIYCEISFVSGFSSTKQSNVGINLGTKYSFQISPSSVRPFQLIGNGTFGTVYRSKLLQSTVQGNERDVITKVSHQHVSNASIEYLETESYINQKLCTHQNQLQHHVNIAPFLGECFQDVEEKLQRTLVWEVAGNYLVLLNRFLTKLGIKLCVTILIFVYIIFGSKMITYIYFHDFWSLKETKHWKIYYH